MIHKKGTWELNAQHPLSERFHAILAEIGALHNKKQADYGRDADPFANVRGSEEWGVKPWVGAMVRLNDKVKRLQKAAQGGTLANEGVIDSLNDIAVYAVIARCLYEEETSTITQPPAPSSSGPETRTDTRSGSLWPYDLAVVTKHGS